MFKRTICSISICMYLICISSENKDIIITVFLLDSLSPHPFLSLCDQTRNILIWKLTAKYDIEFDRTSLKCMGRSGGATVLGNFSAGTCY